MHERTKEIVRALSERAEEACRRYLSNGRRIGNYWIVGDCRNTKGRSMYVRLKATARSAAGRWTDSATAEHGDILDIIAASIGAASHADAIIEAERFLGSAASLSLADCPSRDRRPAGAAERAARLFESGRPVVGTLAERYLRNRGIVPRIAGSAVRFHPSCYRTAYGSQRDASPAILAAVRNNDGRMTGVMRTYLRRCDADVRVIMRKAMGDLAGNGVRFGPNAVVMAVGEGVETVLSLRMAMPGMSMVSALSAAHVAAWISPPSLRRVYIAVDQDAAGRNAAMRLRYRLEPLGVVVIDLTPQRKDFNDDLTADGLSMLRARIADQLHAEDRNQLRDMRASPIASD
ncbi:MAG TPA: DNA primase [Parvularcula sp.]|nr:DNA primase [Parvularcula sp.]